MCIGQDTQTEDGPSCTSQTQMIRDRASLRYSIHVIIISIMGDYEWIV